MFLQKVDAGLRRIFRMGEKKILQQRSGNEFHGVLSGYTVDVDRQLDSEINQRNLQIFVDNARAVDPVTIQLWNPGGGTGDLPRVGVRPGLVCRLKRRHSG